MMKFLKKSGFSITHSTYIISFITYLVCTTLLGDIKHMIIIFLPAIYTYTCGRTRGVVNIVLQNIFVILQKIQSSEKNQELGI